MNSHPVRAAILFIMFCGSLLVRAQDMDKELAALATKLATITKDNGKKKVTVLDFADLQGAPSELGKWIAEELTVDLVLVKKDFSVLDRANLRKILAEYKLTATGLVDPENAKKLGQFAGVDALILGTVIPKGQKITLTVKLITTDTAEIVGAAKAEFKSDETVQRLISQPATESAAEAAPTSAKESPMIAKSFGDLRVELQSLRIVNGRQYLLTINATNQSPKQTVWMTLHSQGDNTLKSTFTDPEGFEFSARTDDISGLAFGYWLQYLGLEGSITTLKPGTSVSGTIKFAARGRDATSGQCRLQLGIICFSVDGYGKIQGVVEKNFMTDMKVN
jgi:TolB-like protein